MKKLWLLFVAILVIICGIYGANAEIDGWKKEGAYLCYYSDGEKVTGTQTINSDIFYFSDDGYLKGNGHVQNARYYGIIYIDENNQLVTGWQTIDGSTYYFFPETGKAAAYDYLNIDRSVSIDGIRYAFDYNGKLLINNWYYDLYGDNEGKTLSGYQTIGSYHYLFSDTGIAQSGFHEINGEIHYFDAGSGEKKKEIYGWRVISGSLYYFDLQTGSMYTSTRTIDETLYTFNDLGALQHDGPIVLKYESNAYLYGFDENNERLSGLSTINGSIYYFDPLYYWASKGFKRINDDYYYFDQNGMACTNQLIKTPMFPGSSEEYVYYYDTDGKRAYGWQTVDGSKYYIGEKGAYYGYKSIDNEQYYFDVQGRMQAGCLVWFTYWDSNRLICLDSNGKQLTGWQEYEGSLYYFTPFANFGDVYIDGKHYFFNEEGKMQRNSFQWIKQYAEPDVERLFYYGEDGIRVSGWQTIDGSLYYSDDSQGMYFGCRSIDNEYYFFNEQGVMQSNCLEEVQEWNGVVHLYYFGADGKRITGWKEIAGETYYFAPEAYTDAWGIDNNYYYFDKNGKMQTNLLKKTRVHQWDEDEHLYYYGLDGKRVFGWQTINGSTYYFDYAGAYYGVHNPGGGPYYFDDNGKMQTNLLIKIHDGETDHVYYFGSDGKQVSGWHTINGAKYYFWSEGAYIGHQVVDGIGYYFDTDGKMKTNSLLQEEFDGTVYTYYFGNDGKQVNDWATIDGATYYFYPDRYTDAWEIKGEYYYFDESGRLKKNLVKKTRRSQWDETENLYYYGPDGKRTSGWQTINGSTYFFDYYTYIACTGTMTDGNITYSFADDGKLINKTVHVNSISLDVTKIFLVLEETYKLTATVRPSDATNKNIIWKSDDFTIAQVTSDGLVVGISAGNTIIHASTEDGGYSTFCHVSVTKLDKVEAFVTRCYSIILGRQPDAGGLRTWYNELVSGRKAAAEIIDCFVRSAEFQNKKLSNADAVEILYKAMLGRGSDAAGKSSWVAQLESGKPLQAVINGFCGSAEFNNICKTYGINPGTVTVPDTQPDQQAGASDDKIRAFVTRCYSIILGRNPDEGGLNTWFNELKSGRKAASEIIDAFVRSQEFQNKKYSNVDAVEILYKAMLGRGSDAAGKADWVSKLEAGKPLATVINGFCGSTEFKAICDSYGIQPGTVSVTEQPAGASDEKIRAFVTRCYKIILGREPDGGGMNTWFNELKSRRKAAAEIIEAFVNSQEFQNKRYSNPDAVEILYKAMLGRGSDAKGKADWVAKLNNGQPLTAVINGFCGSAEFKAICDAYGITPGSVKVQQLNAQAMVQEEPVVKKTEKKANLVEIVNPSDNAQLGTAVEAIYINEEKAKEFIGRCYRSILGREASEAELENWISQMMNGSKTADQIARGFLFSGEFKGKNISSEELVKILYRVYMNREADAEGLATWTQRLDEGTSLQALLDLFAKTHEFKAVIRDMAQ